MVFTCPFSCLSVEFPPHRNVICGQQTQFSLHRLEMAACLLLDIMAFKTIQSMKNEAKRLRAKFSSVTVLRQCSLFSQNLFLSMEKIGYHNVPLNFFTFLKNSIIWPKFLLMLCFRISLIFLMEILTSAKEKIAKLINFYILRFLLEKIWKSLPPEKIANACINKKTLTEIL